MGRSSCSKEVQMGRPFGKTRDRKEDEAYTGSSGREHTSSKRKAKTEVERHDGRFGGGRLAADR